MSRGLISQAVDGQERSGVEKLRDTGRLGYQAASFKAGSQGSGVGEALLSFGNSAARLYSNYSEVNKSHADERSNEIIRKLTPEQRRAAVAGGTLLYQDDPDAMEALRFKSGRNAAFEVESEVKQKIADGSFKTQQELSDYRGTRLEDKSKAYAESVGIDSTDQSYQRGFNADIVQRNAAIYDDHAKKLSEQTQAIAQMETVSDLGSMFSDEGFLRGQDAPSEFANYFTASLAKGSIPTEGMAVSALQDSLAKNAAQPGADVFFKGIGDQEVTLYGKQMKIRDIVGPEVLENYQVKSGEAAFKRNREMTQQFTFGIQDALAQSDPHVGLSKLAQLQGGVYKVQDTSVVTSQTEALNSARGRLLTQIGADSVKRVKDMDKQVKSDNKALVFETKYAQRELGDNVSTDWRTFETNTDTGEFKEEDAANFAIKKMAEIDRMSLPAEEKDRLKLSKLRADYAEGPFRKHFQTLTSDAVNQFNGLVAAESAEVNDSTTSRIREFQRIYQSDPATIASLYPEQAALAERVTLLDKSGIGLETMVDAERRKKGLTREEQIMQEQKWGNLLTSSSSSLPYLPAPLRNAARTLYDSEIFRTGDETSAMGAVNDWLSKSTVPFSADSGGQKRSVGAVQKRTLMVDPQNAESWAAGRDIVHHMVREIAKSKPWINEGDITITETPNGIVLNDAVSSLNIPPITPQYLRQYYVLQQQAAQQEAGARKEQKAGEKIGTYKAEQERRKQSPFGGLDPSTGTLEGAAGFKDR
jgi:hypothetical protein